MQAWPMRVLGALNLAFVALGAMYATRMLQMRWNNWPGSPNYQEWAVFLVLNAISIFMILYLGRLGLRLIGKDAEALWKSCILFLGELGYFAAVFYVTSFVLPDSMPTATAAFWGMALNPLLPQFLTGYPLVGLVFAMVILLIRRSPPGAY
jgi:hypothetical protein